MPAGAPYSGRVPPAIPPSAWRAAAHLNDRPAPAELTAARARCPGLSDEEWRVCVEQTLLRRRARSTLGPAADHLWFTDQGLQQASHPAVAGRRARLLVDQGETHLLDLGCGLGLDAVAAQRSGLIVRAVEQDPRTADYASANLGLTVRIADARHEPLPSGTVAFVDPARRQGFDTHGTARRAFDPEQWQPPWSWTQELLRRHPRTLVKAAPGLPHDLIPTDTAVEWVSVAGHLVETTVWGADVRADRPPRAAVLLTPGKDPWQATETLLPATAGERSAPSGALGSWLLEPDPAIIRGHLLAELCDLTGGHLVSDGIAYVTGTGDCDGSWGRTSHVEAVLPARPKVLRGELRRRGIGHVEIRTRGLNWDPQSLRRELRLPGGPAGAQLVFTRLQGRAAAVLVSD